MNRWFIAAALAVVCASVRASDNNNNFLVASAMKNETVKACVQVAKEPGYEIVASVDTTSICFASGTINQVTFYKALRCNEAGNNGPCPKPAAILVATAEFGCAGELVTAICY